MKISKFVSTVGVACLCLASYGKIEDPETMLDKLKGQYPLRDYTIGDSWRLLTPKTDMEGINNAFNDKIYSYLELKKKGGSVVSCSGSSTAVENSSSFSIGGSAGVSYGLITAKASYKNTSAYKYNSKNTNVHFYGMYEGGTYQINFMNITADQFMDSLCIEAKNRITNMVKCINDAKTAKTKEEHEKVFKNYEFQLKKFSSTFGDSFVSGVDLCCVAAIELAKDSKGTSTSESNLFEAGFGFGGTTWQTGSTFSIASQKFSGRSDATAACTYIALPSDSAISGWGTEMAKSLNGVVVSALKDVNVPAISTDTTKIPFPEIPAKPKTAEPWWKDHVSITDPAQIAEYQAAYDNWKKDQEKPKLLLAAAGPDEKLKKENEATWGSKWIVKGVRITPWASVLPFIAANNGVFSGTQFLTDSENETYNTINKQLLRVKNFISLVDTCTYISGTGINMYFIGGEYNMLCSDYNTICDDLSKKTMKEIASGEIKCKRHDDVEIAVNGKDDLLYQLMTSKYTRLIKIYQTWIKIEDDINKAPFGYVLLGKVGNQEYTFAHGFQWINPNYTDSIWFYSKSSDRIAKISDAVCAVYPIIGMDGKEECNPMLYFNNFYPEKYNGWNLWSGGIEKSIFPHVTLEDPDGTTLTSLPTVKVTPVFFHGGGDRLKQDNKGQELNTEFLPITLDIAKKITDGQKGKGEPVYKVRFKTLTQIASPETYDFDINSITKFYSNDSYVDVAYDVIDGNASLAPAASSSFWIGNPTTTKK